MKKALLNNILEIPYKDTDDAQFHHLVRQIRFTQLAAAISIFSHIFYICLYSYFNFRLLLPVSIILAIFLIPYASVFLFTRKGYFQLAKITVALCLNLSIFVNTAIFMGKEPDIHFFFLLFMLFPIMIWSGKRTMWIAVFMVLSLFCFIYVEYLMAPGSSVIHFPDRFIPAVRSITIFFTFVVISFALFIYQGLVIRKEVQLHQQSEQMKHINNELHTRTEELSETIKMRDKFTSVLAHDLKNPLSAVVGFSDLLLKGYDSYPDSRKKKMISTIHEGSELAYEFIDNILLWTRLRTGRFKARPEIINARDIVDSQVAMLQPVLERKNIDLKNQIGKNIVLNSDKFLFSTVMNNLISNAIKYSYQDGKIEITVNESGEDFEFCVKDYGTGISKTTQHKLFEASTTQSLKGTNNEQGTGMGLYLCREFIEISGGKIWVESEPKIGSSFYFTQKKAKVKY